MTRIWPHHAPVHPQGSFKWILLLVIGLVGLVYWALFERMPGNRALVTKAEKYVAEWEEFENRVPVCISLTPIGDAERRYAGAYVGCRHEGVKQGHFHVLTWDSFEYRGLHGRPFAMQVDGGDRWSR